MLIDPTTIGAPRDLMSYDVQVRWMTEWRQHVLEPAQLRQANLDEWSLGCMSLLRRQCFRPHAWTPPL